MIGRLICAIRGRHVPGEWTPSLHLVHAQCGTCDADLWRSRDYAEHPGLAS